MSALILYFSRAGENYVCGTIQNLSVGNTQVVAELLHQLTGADVFQIQPLVPYSGNYSTCIQQAKDDQKRAARPELIAYPQNLAQYRTIYLGYPNYWGTMPMPVFTLLENCSFAGKMINPFYTHEGSGLGRSRQDIARLCPDAKVLPGFAVLGKKVSGVESELKKWLQES